jgi:hypothetical protein
VARIVLDYLTSATVTTLRQEASQSTTNAIEFFFFFESKFIVVCFYVDTSTARGHRDPPQAIALRFSGVPLNPLGFLNQG